MLVLSPSRVADGLRADALSEATKARLLVAGTVFGVLMSGRSLLGFRTWGGLLVAAVYTALLLGGLWSCYRVNAEADNRAFVERYVCLSVPISLWVYGSYTLAYYGLYLVLRDRPAYDAAHFADTVYPYFLLAGFAAVWTYFALLRRFLRRVAVAPTAT